MGIVIDIEAMKKAVSLGISLDLQNYTIKRNGIFVYGEKFSCYVKSDVEFRGEDKSYFPFVLSRNNSKIIKMAVEYCDYEKIKIDSVEEYIEMGKVRITVNKTTLGGEEFTDFNKIKKFMRIDANEINCLLRNKSDVLFLNSGKCYTMRRDCAVFLRSSLDVDDVAIPIDPLRILAKDKCGVTLGVSNNKEFATFTNKDVVIRVKLNDSYIPRTCFVLRKIEENENTFTTTTKEFKRSLKVILNGSFGVENTLLSIKVKNSEVYLSLFLEELVVFGESRKLETSEVSKRNINTTLNALDLNEFLKLFKGDKSLSVTIADSLYPVLFKIGGVSYLKAVLLKGD